MKYLIRETRVVTYVIEAPDAVDQREIETFACVDSESLFMEQLGSDVDGVEVLEITPDNPYTCDYANADPDVILDEDAEIVGGDNVCSCYLKDGANENGAEH